MKAYWEMWPAALSPELCQELINEGNKLEAVEAKAGGQIRPDSRRSKISWIKEEDKNFESLFSFVKAKFHEANEENFQFDIDYLPSIQFTRYHAEDQGHYGWHEDIIWFNKDRMNKHRKLSMVIQLSDPQDYEGGILEIHAAAHYPPPLIELLQRGTIVVFPSFLRHRVVPVTKGTRYSLVAWMEGPHLR